MTKKDKNCKSYREDYNDRKPINGIPCKVGEVMVPIHAKEIVENYKQDLKDGLLCKENKLHLENLETWHMGGRKILVGFVAAERDRAEELTNQFWDDVNAFLNATKKKRCIIYDEEKHMYKRCPNENKCNFCQKETYNSYELSLDEFLEGSSDGDKGSWDPTRCSKAEETDSIVGLRMALTELIDELRGIDPTMAKCIVLLAQEYPKNEIIERLNLPVEKSQAYAYVKKCQKKAKEIYEKNNF